MRTAHVDGTFADTGVTHEPQQHGDDGTTRSPRDTT